MNNFPTGQRVGTAHKQWASRPSDEKFADVFSLVSTLQDRKNNSRVAIKPYSVLKAVAVDGDVRVQTDKGWANLTHHSFNQLSAAAGLPASGLRKSFEQFNCSNDAAKWVADGINLGLEGRGPTESKNANLLLGRNADNTLTIRSFTTEEYARVWDVEVVQKLLLPLTEHGFTNPPAFDGPGGLYAGDRDMFALLCPKNVRRLMMPQLQCDVCREPFEVNGQVFSPFIMVQNSEVGASSFVFTSGLVQAVCANLNLWGVQGLSEVRVIHKGNPWKKINQEFRGFMNKWVNRTTIEEEAQIRTAMKTSLGSDVKSATELVLRKTELAKKVVVEAISTVEKGDLSTGIVSQDPTNLWNMLAALTANARSIPNQDLQIDQVREAGKLMTLVG